MRREKWIVEAYETAEEKERLDMYMICRNHRDEFDEIEAGSGIRDRREESRSVVEPAKAGWNCCGWLLMRSKS